MPALSGSRRDTSRPGPRGRSGPSRCSGRRGT